MLSIYVAKVLQQVAVRSVVGMCSDFLGNDCVYTYFMMTKKTHFANCRPWTMRLLATSLKFHSKLPFPTLDKSMAESAQHSLPRLLTHHKHTVHSTRLCGTIPQLDAQYTSAPTLCGNGRSCQSYAIIHAHDVWTARPLQAEMRCCSPLVLIYKIT